MRLPYLLICAGIVLPATCSTVFAADTANASLKGGTPKTVILRNAISGAESARRETASGDLAADALRDHYNTDIALIPAEEISDTFLSGGVVKVSAFPSLLRYPDDSGDTIATVNLTGTQVSRLIERSVSRFPLAYDGFLQISGMEVRFNSALPRGSRVTRIRIAGNDLKPDKIYSAATTHSLAAGAYGYFSVVKDAQIQEFPTETLKLALLGFVTKTPEIDGAPETRIAAQ